MKKNLVNTHMREYVCVRMFLIKLNTEYALYMLVKYYLIVLEIFILKWFVIYLTENSILPSINYRIN